MEVILYLKINNLQNNQAMITKDKIIEIFGLYDKSVLILETFSFM